MAEERTLGLARAEENPAEEPSKEELQRRMDKARDSISHTVTEIKETVANQVQAVKETLDWREQFKRRPVAWSAGAVGVGFLVGYGVAAIVKGESDSEDTDDDYYGTGARSYSSRPMMSRAASQSSSLEESGNGHDGPSLFQKISHTPAYGRVKDEVANFGEALMQEVGKTAKTVVLPALMASVRNFIGDYLPNSSGSETSRQNASAGGEQNRSQEKTSPGYQPSLERGQA
jgi:hypothetical protein